MLKRIIIYAVLAWVGHAVAIYAAFIHPWHGFVLAAALDLPWQIGLIYWLWGEAVIRFRRWRESQQAPASRSYATD